MLEDSNTEAMNAEETRMGVSTSFCVVNANFDFIPIAIAETTKTFIFNL